MADAAVPIRVHAPAATSVLLVTFDADGRRETGRQAMARDGDEFVASLPEGTVYGLVAVGRGGRYDASKVLLDPYAREVVFPPAFDRAAARVPGRPNSGAGPLAVARPDPGPRGRPRRSGRAPVVYEAHVRGLTIADPESAEPGTYRGLIAQLDRLAALGVSVLELLPVHQNDPHEGSYWGYMPLVFGAVHRHHAASADPAGELAELIAAAHERDLEVWLDVVFNHTTEVDDSGPTYNLRGLADGDYYRLDGHCRYLETTGCGNDLDVTSPAARRLVIDALDRFADLGVDGFRFDLATVVGRHRPFIAELDTWAAHRGVRMIAEPWDAAGRHELGRAWPGRGWLQWNDRFREDVRGFLRAEPGMVGALRERVRGSPDAFDSPLESVNYLTCHDGFTLYDLVAYDRKHNAANGHHDTDGAHDNRSWNCGWEGDAGVPGAVVALRQRQLRNAWCLLAMAHGVPMVAMGDEFGRTQRGNNNAYNQDNETSWVDWARREDFADLEVFVAELLALRHRHPVLSQPDPWGDAVSWFGATGEPDLSIHSRSLAWQVGDLYVMANAWWEPQEFTLQAPGAWRRVVDTMRPAPETIVADGLPVGGPSYLVGPRAVVILER